MSLRINYGSSVFTVPKESVISRLSDARELDLKVLLLLLADSSLLSDSERLAKELDCTSSALKKSVTRWIDAGVFSVAKGEDSPSGQPIEKVDSSAKPAAAPAGRSPLPEQSSPEYSGEQLSQIIQQGGIKSLLDECQKLAGKLFNEHEISKIVAMSDYLRLDNGYILTLFTYCVSVGKKSVAYIEKTAYGLYNDGIDTLPKLEEHLKLKEEYESEVGRLRTLFGIGKRALSPKENEFLRRWLTEWRVPHELIQRAYEITVNNTEKASMPYMNKILESWHNAGYRSVEEVDAALADYQRRKNDKLGLQNQAPSDKPHDSSASFDTDEFFELALQKSYENIV